MDFLSNKYFLGGLILGVVLLGGVFVWFDLTRSTDSTSSPQATTTQEIPEIIINPIPNKPIPALPWPVAVRNNISGEARENALKNIMTLTLALRKDPGLYDHWMDLALYRRSIGDFVGAREAWEYAALLRPEDFIPPHNLGDLYTYDLVDYRKAEASYLASLKLDATAIIVYQKLYELYRFKMKDNAKAKAILEEGIKKNPSTSERLRSILDEWNST